MTMNILQVVTSFPPAYAYGGGAKSSYKLSKALIELGHDVTVFTTDAYDESSRVEWESNPSFLDGIRIFRHRNISNRLAWHANMSSAFGISLSLRRYIEEFDVVHIHEIRSIEAALTWWFCKKTDTPLVVQPRGSAPRTVKSIEKKVFDTLLGKRILSGADRIIASSEIESKQIQPNFPDIDLASISRIPNGIDYSEYSQLPAKGSFRDTYSIKENEPVILFLSRIHERKGADMLIEAFDSLSIDATLVIAGPDDGYLDKLSQLVSNRGLEQRVRFTGPLYDSDKLAAYQDADVFVLPSKNRYESFGNVVIEALACGTPAVVTNVCGVSEWLNIDCTATVEPSVNGIATGIQRILRQHPDGQCDSGYEYIKEAFSWESIAKQTALVYSDIVPPKCE